MDKNIHENLFRLKQCIRYLSLVLSQCLVFQCNTVFRLMKTTTYQNVSEKRLPVRVSNTCLMLSYKSDLISSLSDANVNLAFLNWLSNCCAAFSHRRQCSVS
jgi:hypothetical protein